MQRMRLVHPCRAVVVLVAGRRRAKGELGVGGAYYDEESGDRITHCPGCGEWLGSAFVAAEVDSMSCPRPEMGYCSTG